MTVGANIKEMIRSVHEVDDMSKVNKLYGMVKTLRILSNPHYDGDLSLTQWLYICRDIFGISTFEIDQDLPELDSVEEYGQEENVDPEYGEEEDMAPPGYEIASPMPEQQVVMSNIRETTGEYTEDLTD